MIFLLAMLPGFIGWISEDSSLPTPAAIRIVRAALVVPAARTIRVVDAVWRKLAEITHIRVDDAVSVMRVGVAVASNLVLTFNNYGLSRLLP